MNFSSTTGEGKKAVYAACYLYLFICCHQNKVMGVSVIDVVVHIIGTMLCVICVSFSEKQKNRVCTVVFHRQMSRCFPTLGHFLMMEGSVFCISFNSSSTLCSICVLMMMIIAQHLLRTLTSSSHQLDNNSSCLHATCRVNMMIRGVSKSQVAPCLNNK